MSTDRPDSNSSAQFGSVMKNVSTVLSTAFGNISKVWDERFTFDNPRLCNAI